MLNNIPLKPITGTFVNMLISDTGIVNAGLKEWEQDFRMMKYLGMNKIFVIRTEFEQNGVYLSAEDPRSTTWPEDANLLDMVFRLADKYDMELFLSLFDICKSSLMKCLLRSLAHFLIDCFLIVYFA